MIHFHNAKAATLAGFAALSAAGLAIAAPAGAFDHHREASRSQPNVVEAAQSTGVHETLVAAVTAAGLAGTLSGDGPFTVFAPTDTAFAKLPDGTVAELVKPQNKAALTAILTYHVVSGDVSSADLVHAIRDNHGSYSFETLSGDTLTARLSGDTIVITDAAGRATAVTQADVDVSNGVIHVTDSVFLPG
ncbi:fasciclin domain-containing protein [Alteriqipengyuania sp. WL0013]|uniref:fasciclin domain-containing protein n=1 Tax=Alteriqipengyuania sp. WL0013 TaxID=3110773 RepID=UPI002B6B0CD3|nr:fasciclin domain-containing protein [Alteriqipengyuania sp. WL0013]MEB3415922.1 fasciclin domain-containing protein [Alteriqipengyuania sp. WL0013]